MEFDDNNLQDLLSSQAQKERRAYKRATLPIVFIALLGLFWLGFSAYKVVQLERESSRLDEEIQQQQTILKEVQEETEKTKLELEDAKQQLVVAATQISEAKKSFRTIEKGTESPQEEAKRALKEISNVPKPIVNNPRPEVTPPFLMPIEDVFTIQGRGVVVTGRVERGKLKLNEPVEIVGIRPTKQTVVTGIEMFKKRLDEAVTGDNVGLLLRGVERRDVERGQVIAKPGSIKPHKKFKAKVSMLKKEEGGRQTPIPTGYRPQFYFRTTDVTGVVKLPAGKAIMPGDKNIDVEVELLTLTIAMEPGLRFAVREGGRTVGTGIVTSIIE